MLTLFGNSDVTSVFPTVGAEQEYFLVDKQYYDKRKDLYIYRPHAFRRYAPKGQEMDDHYFGVIKSRVKAFMKDLNDELLEAGHTCKNRAQ